MLSAAFLLRVAVRHLPTGMAYVVFTGMGAVGAVSFGICGAANGRPWAGLPRSP